MKVIAECQPRAVENKPSPREMPFPKGMRVIGRDFREPNSSLVKEVPVKREVFYHGNLREQK